MYYSFIYIKLKTFYTENKEKNYKNSFSNIIFQL